MTGDAGVDADTHVTILAVLTLLGAVAVLFAGLAIFLGVVFGVWGATMWMGPFGGFVPGFVTAIAAVFLVLGILVAIPAVAAGVGLLRRSSWARVLTLVVAAFVGLFALTSFTLVPLAYSAYAFWVLTRDEVRWQFEGIEPNEAAGRLREHGGVQDPPERR